MTQIGGNYKNFLIDKYFGSEANLVSFISEDVYVDLVSDAIKRNIRKISTTIQNGVLKVIGNLNRNSKTE